MFRHILAAVSGTASDAGLLDYARMLVPLGGEARMTCIHVTGASSPRAPELPPECEITGGDLTDAVVEAALRHQADVILLGHRNGERRRRSLARRLAMAAPCSVWMVPDGSPAAIQSVLAPIDFSERSGDALSFATEVAARAGLEQCSALHVDFSPAATTDPEVEAQRIEERYKQFAIFTARLNLHDVDVRPAFVDCPNVARAILQTASDQGVDLIVMNTRGRSRSAAVLLGSETEAVLVGADRPVLALKHFGSRMYFLEALLDKRVRGRGDLRFT